MTASITAVPDTAIARDRIRRVFWHRDLPPADADIVGEYVLEATSERVQGSIAHRDELWDRCYRDLVARTEERFEQEIHRLGGDYAHVLDESIDSRHDAVTNEAWLRGRFTYVLYRRAPSGPAA
jgi:hypothetical protein